MNSSTESWCLYTYKCTVFNLKVKRQRQLEKWTWPLRQWVQNQEKTGALKLNKKGHSQFFLLCLQLTLRVKLFSKWAVSPSILALLVIFYKKLYPSGCTFKTLSLIDGICGSFFPLCITRLFNIVLGSTLNS